MQIVSNVALISINATLIVQLISFLIFLYLINRIMFRPLRQVMAEREFHLDKIQADVADAHQTYDDLLQEIEGEEAQVRKAAQKLSQEHEEAGAKEASRIFNEVRTEIQALREKANEEVNSQLAAARKQIDAESKALSVTIMERVLNRRLSA